MRNHFQQISAKINKLSIEELAIQSGFQKRKPRKIDAVGFVTGFMMMALLEKNSLSDWARAISRNIGELVSKQAVEKKLQFRQQAFGYQLLGAAIRQSLCSEKEGMQTKLFSWFTKVYLEDSTCLKLPVGLADFFPGSYSHRGKCATAKIQLRMELLAGSYEDFSLQSFRDNDQKHAGNILSVLKAGDLVLRDLGYWSLRVFGSIAQAGAFFLSRYRYGVICLNPETGEEIRLDKLLKKQDRQGLTVLDRPVLMGKQEQVPVRLVAIKAPAKVAQIRRRKAAKNRNKRANHSKAYMELLEWTIFITNVASQAWSHQDIQQAYRFRWRIETIFKCWKSKFHLQRLFDNKQSLSPARVVISCLLFLVFLTLFFVRWLHYFTQIVYQATGKWVSLFKFADFVKERFEDLLLSESLPELIPQVAYYCTYEKRKDRCNFLEYLYETKLS